MPSTANPTSNQKRSQNRPPQASVDEIADDENAPKEIKALYQEIKATMQTNLVNLIFRKIAALEGCLEIAWTKLRPLYAKQLPSLAHHLLLDVAQTVTTAPIQPLPACIRSILGLSKQAERSILALLHSYQRNNTQNCIAFSALLTPPTTPSNQPRNPASNLPSPPPPSTQPTLPALPNLDALPPDLKASVLYLNGFGGQNNNPGPVVSLYRHLALWPNILPPLAVLLAGLQHSGWLQTQAQLVRQRTLDAVQSLGGLADPAFSTRISPMIAPLTTITLPKMIPIIAACTHAFQAPST